MSAELVKLALVCGAYKPSGIYPNAVAFYPQQLEAFAAAISAQARASEAEDAKGGLSCDGCREWITANNRGGWIDNMRNRVQALEIRLATQGDAGSRGETNG